MLYRMTQQFRQAIWEYYRANGRHDLPWRRLEADGTLDPYKVLVSELMLQQTQVPRVIPKFEAFIWQFPDVRSLAAASLADALRAWNGLGYNRRAKFLWQAAGMIVHDFGGRVPERIEDLVKLPGVGYNTAGAIAVYAYNRPVVFIETNIRTVFIHHFFAGEAQVPDKAVADLVAQTLPDNPRDWYWALMDYGSHLKRTVGNVSKRSKHYAKQSAFDGSRRQIRGQVLRSLAASPHTETGLARIISDERLGEVLGDLQREGLVSKDGPQYSLADGGAGERAPLGDALLT